MSDDTSSHVRVFHLYDELLYSFSAIEIKCWLHYVREKYAHTSYAHTSASRWHYILTRCCGGLKSCQNLTLTPFVVFGLLPFKFYVD